MQLFDKEFGISVKTKYITNILIAMLLIFAFYHLYRFFYFRGNCALVRLYFKEGCDRVRYTFNTTYSQPDKMFVKGISQLLNQRFYVMACVDDKEALSKLQAEFVSSIEENGLEDCMEVVDSQRDFYLVWLSFVAKKQN